jgi:hypothetical protein
LLEEAANLCGGAIRAVKGRETDGADEILDLLTLGAVDGAY